MVKPTSHRRSAGGAADASRPGTAREPGAAGTGKTPGPEPKRGGLDPAEILSGWKQAVDITGRTLLATPLALAGVPPRKPARGELAQAARGFPIIGLVIGLAGALVYAVADGLGLPPLLSALLAVGVIVFIEGAQPEGSLARMADALVAETDKAGRLRALQADRPGAYGTIVLVIDYAPRAGAVAWLAWAGEVAAALAASCAASRGVLPLIMHYLPPARRSGFAFTAGTPRLDQAVLAALLGVAIAFLFLGPLVGIVALAVGALGALKFAWLAKRMLGGVTGAVLGAAQQGAEIGMLLAIVALH